MKQTKFARKPKKHAEKWKAAEKPPGESGYFYPVTADVTDRFLKDYKLITTYDTNNDDEPLYLFNGRFYEPGAEGKIKGIAESLLNKMRAQMQQKIMQDFPELTKTERRQANGVLDLIDKWLHKGNTKSEVSEVLNQIRRQTFVSPDILKAYDNIIPTQNGHLHLKFENGSLTRELQKEFEQTTMRKLEYKINLLLQRDPLNETSESLQKLEKTASAIGFSRGSPKEDIALKTATIKLRAIDSGEFPYCPRKLIMPCKWAPISSDNSCLLQRKSAVNSDRTLLIATVSQSSSARSSWPLRAFLKWELLLRNWSSWSGN